MKIVYKDIDKNGAGTITVITESLEDMWHAYNLITVGDRVRASTFRKVAKESATGSTEKERKRITVTIEVKAIDFDANSGIIRLNGQNVEENQFIKVQFDFVLFWSWSLHWGKLENNNYILVVNMRA